MPMYSNPAAAKRFDEADEHGVAINLSPLPARETRLARG